MFGLLLVLSWGTCLGVDWPEFRGPTGQGHAAEASIPWEWGPKKNVHWRVEVPGKGWSSSAVVDGKVYLTSAIPVRGSRALALTALCLNAQTGKQEWSCEVFREQAESAPRIHTKNSHASPTPLVAHRRLYVHFGHMGTACLDLSGKVLWKNNSLRYQPVHGNGGSPILVDDTLIYCADGADVRSVVALHAGNGKLKWRFDRAGSVGKSFSFATPLAIDVDGKRQVICPGSNVVNALDPKTGKELWRVHYEGYSVVPRPVFGHGLVYVCTGYDRAQLLAIKPTGKGDVTESHVAWRARRAMPNTPSPLLVDDAIYVVSDQGVASCLEAATGRELWQERLGGNYSASPVQVNGHIIFQSEEGVATVIKPGRQFARIARNDLSERTLASMAIADGAMFIRTESALYRIQNEGTTTPRDAAP